MEARIYKPKRLRNGKRTVGRLYRARIKLAGDSAVRDIALQVSDKQVAQQKLNKLIQELEHESAGLIPAKAERDAAQSPLLDLVSEYVNELTVLGRSEDHLRHVDKRLRRLVRECGWTRLADVTPTSFQTWRKEQAGKAPKTLNEYLAVLSAFWTWLRKQGRVAVNPFELVERADTRGKERVQRRALSDEEASRLLQVAGENRLAYMLPLYAGLRRNEVKTLRWSSLVLGESGGLLRVHAAVNKNRKEQALPLHQELIKALQQGKPAGGKADDLVLPILNTFTVTPGRNWRRNISSARKTRRFLRDIPHATNRWNYSQWMKSQAAGRRRSKCILQTAESLTKSISTNFMTITDSTIKHRTQAPRAQRRSISDLLSPLEKIAATSLNLITNHDAQFDINGDRYELPRYLFVGPNGGDTPIRIGVFAAIHGDEQEGAHAVVQFIKLLETKPELAAGYYLSFYPVCNPTGFEDGTRFSRSGRDLNREFWKNSPEPEVRLLQAELVSRSFQGIISLHTDDTSVGFYGFAHGATLTKHLIEPALAAAERFLPRNELSVIDGFAARNGIIRDTFYGILSAPPKERPRPFEIILETPASPPEYLKATAFVAALQTILTEYRKFIAYAPNL